MVTWSSDFDEVAGTYVQDCGSSAGFWVNASLSYAWWVTDGAGLLGPGTGSMDYNLIYHLSNSADQSIDVTFIRTSPSSRKPSFGLRSTAGVSSSEVQYFGTYCVIYENNSWKLYYGWSLKASIADADFILGVADPDGDETRRIVFSWVGTTLSLSIYKGSGKLVGTATTEDAYGITDPGTIAVLFGGKYSENDYTYFGVYETLTAVDGVSSGVHLRVRRSGAWATATRHVWHNGAWMTGTTQA